MQDVEYHEMVQMKERGMRVKRLNGWWMEEHEKDSIQEIALFSFHQLRHEESNLWMRIKCKCYEILLRDYEAGTSEIILHVMMPDVKKLI